MAKRSTGSNSITSVAAAGAASGILCHAPQSDKV
jgi:hypothetical protein